MKESKGRRLAHSRYITGFDGIRTLAVIGVIVYHLLPYKMQGGYLGVPIFFVVSGYLITDLLLQEYEQNHKIDVWAFYVRRLKRLYPALVTMVLSTAAYITLFQRSLLKGLRDIIWTNLLYIYNWWEIDHGQSYFDRFNGESPFTHLWSLSIEGQYYLVWPVLLIGLLWAFKQRKQIFYLLMSLTVLSGAWMATLSLTGASSNRLYYGTDTRLFAILFGVALAVVWPATKLKAEISQRSRLIMDALGIVSLIGIGCMFFTLAGQSKFTYLGGMFIFTFLSAILVGTIAHPGADMNRLFTNPVFDWIGKRSYGIYLYQFPVMIFYETKVTNIAAHPLLNALIEVVIILIISDLSYRYLERPFRRYNYSHLKGSIVKLFSKESPYGWKRLWAVLAAFILVVAMTGAVTKPTKSSVDNEALQSKIKDNSKEVAKRNKALEKKRAAMKVESSAKKESEATEKLTGRDKELATEFNLTKTQIMTAKQMPVTAVGDSVMIDVSTDLQKIFPQMIVDGKVGRQVWDSMDVIKNLKARGQLSQTVLMHLGTNGPMTSDQLNDILNEIGPDRKVYWVNAHVPTRNWEGSVNRTLDEAAKKNDNLTIIDWHKLSENHQDWFYKDNVHPNPTGNRNYATLATQVMTNPDNNKKAQK